VDYRTSPDAAERQMAAAYARFASDGERLGDGDLAVEVEFAKKLLALVQQRAEQGTLY
jgi:hypothetical protein